MATKKNSKLFNFNIPLELNARLQDFSKKNKRSMTDIVIEGIEQMLKNSETEGRTK